VEAMNTMVVSSSSTWVSRELKQWSWSAIVEDSSIQFPPEDCVDRLLDASSFEFAVIMPEAPGVLNRLFGATDPIWPQVVLSFDDAIASRPLLGELVLKGFRLLISLSMNPEAAEERIRTSGYTFAGTSKLGDGRQHDPFLTASKTGELGRLRAGVAVAERLGSNLLFCTSHDGDSAYLLVRSEGTT
jgi:hypothetical protein